jgi:glyoxylase-like metal-dependent hydrolase (beta-lactamase superfamily II)
MSAVPDIEDLGDGVHRVVVPFEGAALIDSTDCYVVADDEGGLLLVDPGSRQDVSDRALRVALSELGRSVDDVRTIVATHAHHDHVGWATRAPASATLAVGRREVATLARPFSVVVTPGLLDRWGVPADERADLVEPPAAAALDVLVPGRLLDDGDRLDVPGHDVRVIATPGHTAGSISLDVDGRLVLTGDAVLPQVNPGLGMGGFDEADDVIGTALASLDRLAARGAVICGPGHGRPFADLRARSEEIAARHLARADEVARLAETHGAGVWDVASRMTWTGGWEGVRGYLRISALRQTELHLRRLGAAGLGAGRLSGTAPIRSDAPGGAASGRGRDGGRPGSGSRPPSG